MAGPSWPLQTAMDCTISAPGRVSASPRARWPVLLLAALLSLLVGAALWNGSGSRRSATAGRARPGVSSHEVPSVFPEAALGPVSASLGRSDRAYWLSASGAGFGARNPAQRLDLRFGRSGV